ncbi:glycoside hydrolase family 16 protein [Mycena maculata]|uniref:Glycoside hydrolase family 16 protein n=1 Tax=Mycena maculata TaxID=230809 RepID=A0AAD7K0R6_9AGAR|nr:glycoside hydrolase family 16 protein [Mycena maculata]
MPTIAASFLSLLCLLSATSGSIPSLSGYNVVFSDDFNGDHYAGIDLSNWNQITGNPGDNGELEQYTSGTGNVHLSGDGQMYIVPTIGPFEYLSGRVESTGSWACDDGNAMIFQAELWVPDYTGDPAQFAGYWPSFWAKGNDYRTSGTSWPLCGEWDIFEVTDWLSNQNQGTLHFIDSNGNNNGNFNGRVTYAGGQYHTWAFKVDRRNSDWTQQELTWYLDGDAFYSVTGADIGTHTQWEQLAYYPYYIIINLAIGGSYPGDPGSDTIFGYDASMRVEYVAVYKT